MYSDDLVSVIIPVYNCEKYVRQTLDSIINQTYRNLEILLIDDGSKDNSLAICREYLTDERVKVFPRENAGVAASRQFGVDECRGSYFVTIDSDDYVALDYVEKLYKVIKAQKADVSVCGVTCFTDEKDSDFYGTVIPQTDGEKLVVTGEMLASDFFKISCNLVLTDSWNKMFRTQFVKDTNVRYALPSIYRGSDLQVNHKLAIHCPTYAVCREVLLFHRIHEGSKVNTKDRPIQQGFEIITESLIKESEAAGLSIMEELSKIYYSLLGLVVNDIFIRGGSIREKHGKFNAMISRNNAFLVKHTTHIRKFKAFDTFRMSNYDLPFFMLNNALWLDVVSAAYCTLMNIKIRLRERRVHRS